MYTYLNRSFDKSILKCMCLLNMQLSSWIPMLCSILILEFPKEGITDKFMVFQVTLKLFFI